MVTLSADARVAGRPFTDPDHLSRDAAVLDDVRQALLRRVIETGEGGTWREPGGDEHLLVLPSLTALRTTRPAVAVGFFGQARAGVDHTPIMELERHLLSRAAGFRGFLAYHNVHVAAAHAWGNLVVFADHDAPGEVACDDEHRLATAATPAHYHSLRLHRFELPDGVFGSAGLHWLRSTYLDFTTDPPWRGVRTAGSSAPG
jgi:hypothetical protein